MYELTILGSSSAIPTVEKNPTAQLLNANERFFLIDCAEGTQIQLRKYKFKFQKISRIFISHLHGDHYFGLIGLISSMHLLGREKELHIYAHKKLKEIIDVQLSASLTELCYPLFFHPITPNVDQVLFEDKKIKISTFPLSHGIDCNGFLFKEKRPPVGNSFEISSFNSSSNISDFEIAKILSLCKSSGLYFCNSARRISYS